MKFNLGLGQKIYELPPEAIFTLVTHKATDAEPLRYALTLDVGDFHTVRTRTYDFHPILFASACALYDLHTNQQKDR